MGNSGLKATIHMRDIYNDALMLDGKPWKENLDPITDRRHERGRDWRWMGKLLLKSEHI
jgi:hypothetical protein